MNENLPAPPIDAIQPWWPLITAALSGLGFVISSLWAAYTALQNSKSQRQADEAKIEFDTRKDFVDDLMDECKVLREECKMQRKTTSDLMGNVMERDMRIKEQAEEINRLNNKISNMQTQIDTLTKHVAALESRADK